MKALKFGKLEFKHKPMTMHVIITLSDEQATLKECLECFAEFVNDNKLTSKPVGWQEISKQGSKPQFFKFVNEWFARGEEGNASEGPQN